MCLRVSALLFSAAPSVNGDSLQLSQLFHSSKCGNCCCRWCTERLTLDAKDNWRILSLSVHQHVPYIYLHHSFKIVYDLVDNNKNWDPWNELCHWTKNNNLLKNASQFIVLRFHHQLLLLFSSSRAESVNHKTISFHSQQWIWAFIPSTILAESFDSVREFVSIVSSFIKLAAES